MNAPCQRPRWARWAGAALAAVLLVTAVGVPPARAAPGDPVPPDPTGAVERLLVPARYFIVTADELVGYGARVTPVPPGKGGPYEVVVHFDTAEIRNLALTQDLSTGKPLYLQITSDGVARVTGVSMRTDLLSLIGTIPGTARGTDPVEFLLDLLESGGKVTLRIKDVGMRATWMRTGSASLPSAVLRFVHDTSELAQRDRIERAQRQRTLRQRQVEERGGPARRGSREGQDGTIPGDPGAPGAPAVPGQPALPEQPAPPGLPIQPKLPGVPLPPGVPAPPASPGMPDLPSPLADLVRCLQGVLERDPLQIIDRDTLLRGDLEEVTRAIQAVAPAAARACGLTGPAGSAPDDTSSGPGSRGDDTTGGGTGGNRDAGGHTEDGGALPGIPNLPQLPVLNEAMTCVAGVLAIEPERLAPLAGEKPLTLDRLVGWLLQQGLAPLVQPGILRRLETECGPLLTGTTAGKPAPNGALRLPWPLGPGR